MGSVRGVEMSLHNTKLGTSSSLPLSAICLSCGIFDLDTCQILSVRFKKNVMFSLIEISCCMYVCLSTRKVTQVIIFGFHHRVSSSI